MRKTIENIIIGILIVSLILTVLGVVLANDVLTKAAVVVLMLVAITYAVLQVMDYFDMLKLDDKKKQKSSFWFMIISVAVALTIICVGIFVLAGKLLQ